jgi:ABC-type xylose transport system permease subunit
MAENSGGPRKPRVWIAWIGFVILLIFLYFYKPFENLVSESIRGISASTVIFWFAALVGVVAYAIAHWQSYRQKVFRNVSDLDAEGLVFDTLQTAILVAVILCAGGILQVIEMLGAHLINNGAIIGPVFGGKLLAIILLVILAIAFYLLHRMVRAFRLGRRPGKLPPRLRPTSRGSGD